VEAELRETFDATLVERYAGPSAAFWHGLMMAFEKSADVFELGEGVGATVNTFGLSRQVAGRPYLGCRLSMGAPCLGCCRHGVCN
jgi:hypothetical protein